MNKPEAMLDTAPTFRNEMTLCHPRVKPVDPRWGLGRWQRFVYALKVLTGRETFQQRMARRYHD